jgi:predicted kinase
MTHPLLIVVTGLPGTGKTEMGRYLARELQLPLIYKDGIKETLFDSLGVGDWEWSRKLGSTTYSIMTYILEALMPAGISLVLESNFHPQRAGPDLAQLVARHNYSVVQILCKAAGPTLVERFQKRAKSGHRHAGHVDNWDELLPQLLRGRIDPVPLAGPLIEVDTTDFDMVDYEAILQSVRDVISTQRGNGQR